EDREQTKKERVAESGYARKGLNGTETSIGLPTSDERASPPNPGLSNNQAPGGNESQDIPPAFVIEYAFGDDQRETNDAGRGIDYSQYDGDPAGKRIADDGREDANGNGQGAEDLPEIVTQVFREHGACQENEEK